MIIIIAFNWHHSFSSVEKKMFNNKFSVNSLFNIVYNIIIIAIIEIKTADVLTKQAKMWR